MENKKRKCSSIDHEETDANYYCGECKIYICNKCEKYHSKLFKNHQIINFENNNEEIFSGFCAEKGHQNKLEYF